MRKVAKERMRSCGGERSRKEEGRDKVGRRPRLGGGLTCARGGGGL